MLTIHMASSLDGMWTAGAWDLGASPCPQVESPSALAGRQGGGGWGNPAEEHARVSFRPNARALHDARRMITRVSLPSGVMQTISCPSLVALSGTFSAPLPSSKTESVCPGFNCARAIFVFT